MTCDLCPVPCVLYLPVFTVVWLFIFILCSTLHSLQVKNNWKCDSQELFERKLVVYFVLHYSRKGSSGKDLILKFILLRMVINFDMIGFLVFTHSIE